MFTPEEVKKIDKADKEINHGWTVNVNKGKILISLYIPIDIKNFAERMVDDGKCLNRSEALRFMLRSYIDFMVPNTD